MPPRNSSIALSDDEFDELASGDELEQVDLKPEEGPYGGQIVKPRLVTTSCKSLYEYIHNGTVELCPAYQRDVVWNESKMIGLIQSLFLNFYIPPIVFAVSIDENKEDKRVCIDGKQRCSSIVDFISGKIPFISPATGEKFWYCKSVKMGARGKLAPPAMRSRFDMTQIQAVEYDCIPDAVQRDIFQRVQMGAPLSAAEKLQAIPGSLTTWINELLKKYVLEEDTLTEYIDWDVSRGKPFQIIASMTAMCWYTESRKVITAIDLKKWLEKDLDLDDAFKKRMEMVLSLMIQIAKTYKSVAFDVVGTKKAPRMSPVEMWFMGYIIFLRMGVSSQVTLARQIGELRKDVRAKFRDVFSNNTTVTFMYKWVEKLPVEKPRAGQEVAAIEWQSNGLPHSSGIGKKRKNVDDDDTDYRGSSSRSSRAAAPPKTRRTTDPPSRPSSSINRPAAPPPPAAARPPASSMDAAPGPQFGMQHSGINPYATHDQRQYQRSANSVYGPATPAPAAQSGYGNAAALQHQVRQQASQQPTWAQYPARR